MSVSTVSPAQRRRAVTAGTIGNFVEWFDFTAFGALAVVLAPLFFPASNPIASLLATFATFAVAFLFRPLGGFLFGLIGDRWGRRSSLSATVLLMSATTMVIGLLPTAQSIGVWAAVLIVLARCLQGFALGGEYTGSAVYMVEFGDQRRRALFASLTPSSGWLGAMTGVAIVTGLFATLGPEAVASWAWRMPFLLAGPLGLVGLYLRLRLQDTPTFERLKAAQAVEKTPIRKAFRTHGKAMLVIFIGSAAGTASGYLLLVYMVSYLTTTVGVSRGLALTTNLIAVGVAVAASLVGGLLADRYGRKPVYLWAVGLQMVLAVPMFLLIGRGDLLSILVGQCVLAAVNGAMLAPFAVLCVELFPARIRNAAAGVGYSVGAGLLGGISPLVATALVAATGLEISPAFYISGSLLAAMIVVGLFTRETLGLELDEDVERATAATDPLTPEPATPLSSA